MTLPCGVTLGLNNLKGELDTRLNAILNINIGTPAGLAEIAGKIEGELGAIKDKIGEAVVIPPVLKSLRGELAELAALPFAGLAAAAKIVSIAADYAGITNVSGFANLNLTDLAKSVFSISGTFDPCSATIPNITLDPSGIIQSLPSIQPPFGSTLLGAKVFAPDRQIIDNLGEAIKNNIPIVASTSVLESASTALDATAPIVTAAKEKVRITKIAIESNVSTSITGMGDMVKKLPNGEEVVETKSDFVERVKYNSLPIMDEEQIPPPKKDDPEAIIKRLRPGIGFEGDTTVRDNFDKTWAPLIRAGCPVGSSGFPDLGCLDTPEEAKARAKSRKRRDERRQRWRKFTKAERKKPVAERKSYRELRAEFDALPENNF